MKTEMNENSKTPLKSINENFGGLEDIALRMNENSVSNMNKLEKEAECHRKRKNSDIEVDGQHNDNENLPVHEPKSKKAKRGRPASAKKCSSTSKQRTRAKNKRWSDSDSQMSDHDMYKGTISSVPLKKRETTQRKAASKVKYTFDTDEEENEERSLSYVLFQEKFSKKEQGNGDNKKVEESKQETKETAKELNENDQLALDCSSTEFNDDIHENENTCSGNELKDDNEPMESTKHTRSGEILREPDSVEISGKVSKMVKNLSLTSSSIISDSSSDSSFSLFIDLKIPAAEVTDNPRIRENTECSKRQVEKMDKPTDPRIRRRALILESKIEKPSTDISPGNDDVEAKAHMRDDDDDRNRSTDNVSPAYSPLQWSGVSPRFSSPSDDASNSSSC